jgi:hypothetical protein
MAGLLSLCFHTPDGDFEMAHVTSRKGSNVRSVECNHQRAAFGATHPVCAGMVEELQTISGPGKTTSDASMVGRLAPRQQHAHHPSSLSERQSGAEFGLDAHKLGCGSPANQR